MTSHGVVFTAFPILFVLLFVALIVAAVFGFIAAHKRRQREIQERMALAPTIGLRYEVRPIEDIAGRYRFLDALPRGERRYAEHLMAGTYKGLEVRLFDWIWVTSSTDSKGNRQEHHHYHGVALAHTGERYPKLSIVPETWGHKLWDAVGGEDIDFESDEFSRRFWVKSADRKFAYDVCHARMMEHLLGAPLKQWQLEGDVVATWRSGRIAPGEIVPMLDGLVAFVELLPGYVRTTAIGRRDARPAEAEWKDGWWQSPRSSSAPQTPSGKR